MNNTFGFNSGGLAGNMVFSGFQDASAGMNSAIGQGGAFSNVFNQMSGGIQQNAMMGIAPGQNMGGQRMTQAQIAAQMQMGGGITSLLPMLGNSFLPRLMFPVAGMMTFFQVAQSALQMKNELDVARPQLGLDPSELNYNQAIALAEKSNNDHSYLGPIG